MEQGTDMHENCGIDAIAQPQKASYLSDWTSFKDAIRHECKRGDGRILLTAE